MRRLITQVITPPLIGLITGCSSGYSSSGCGSEPIVPDAILGRVGLQSYAPPCGFSDQISRGSNPHLEVSVGMSGLSGMSCLVAVKVDGQLVALVERTIGVFGMIDLGPYEPPDTAWHEVEVVVDPLNLLTESDESNNRGTQLVRVIDPDVGVDQFSRIRLAGQFNPVEVVPFGSAVEIIQRTIYEGPYVAVMRSVRIGTTLDVTDTVGYSSCSKEYPFPLRIDLPELVTAWTPPAPGDYDIEFSVEPIQPATDRIPSNNVLIKRLTVTPPPPAPGAIGVADKRRGGFGR